MNPDWCAKVRSYRPSDQMPPSSPKKTGAHCPHDRFQSRSVSGSGYGVGTNSPAATANQNRPISSASLSPMHSGASAGSSAPGADPVAISTAATSCTRTSMTGAGKATSQRCDGGTPARAARNAGIKGSMVAPLPSSSAAAFSIISACARAGCTGTAAGIGLLSLKLSSKRLPLTRLGSRWRFLHLCARSRVSVGMPRCDSLVTIAGLIPSS